MGIWLILIKKIILSIKLKVFLKINSKRSVIKILERC